MIIELHTLKMWHKPYVYLGSTRGRRLDFSGVVVRRVDCRGFKKLGRTLKLAGSRSDGDRRFRISKCAKWCGPPPVSGTQQCGVNLDGWINSAQVYRSILPLPPFSFQSVFRNRNTMDVGLPHLVTSSRKLLAFADLLHIDSRADPVYLAQNYLHKALDPLGPLTPFKIQIRKSILGRLSYRYRFSVRSHATH